MTAIIDNLLNSAFINTLKKVPDAIMTPINDLTKSSASMSYRLQYVAALVCIAIWFICLHSLFSQWLGCDALNWLNYKLGGSYVTSTIYMVILAMPIAIFIVTKFYKRAYGRGEDFQHPFYKTGAYDRNNIVSDDYLPDM